MALEVFKKKMAKCVLSEIQGAEFYAEEVAFAFKMNLCVSVMDEIAQFHSHEVYNRYDDNEEEDNDMEDNEEDEIAQITSPEVDNIHHENEEDDNEMEQNDVKDNGYDDNHEDYNEMEENDENEEEDYYMEDNEVKENEVVDEEDEIAQIPSPEVDNVDDENDEDYNEMEENDVKDNSDDDNNEDYNEIEESDVKEDIEEIVKNHLLHRKIAQNDSTQTNNHEDIEEIVKKYLLHSKIVKEVIVGDNDKTHEVHLINMMSMLSQEHVLGYVLDHKFFEEFDKKTSTNDLDEWKFLLSREITSHQNKNKVNVLRNIAQIPSDLPKNKVNCDKMIHIKNDHQEIVEIDTNQDTMFLYQDLYLGKQCPRMSSSKSKGHSHFKFTKPNSYSPKGYRRIVKKYFIKKFKKYYPSEKSTQKEMFNFVQCFVFDIRLAMHCLFTQKEEFFIESLDLFFALDKMSKLFLLSNKANWKKWKIENEFYNFYNFFMFKKELFIIINSL